MNVGSLFAGIGGFDLGLERAGMRTVWQVEIDAFRRAVLARHFPDAERFEDVRKVGVHNLAPVDLICGGFPCQDLSVAGKGAGIDGARSGLWAQFARIIGELRPRYVVVENVPALLARGFERVLGDLAALGYDAEWGCLPASAFGAPHRRDRVWIVAYPECAGLEGFGFSPGQSEVAQSRDGGTLADASRDGEVGPTPASGSERQRVGEGCEPESANASPPGQLRAVELEDNRSREQGRSGSDAFSQGQIRSGPGWWEFEPDVGRVAHGVPRRVDRLAALGDALVPQIAEWIGRRLMDSA